MTRWLPSLNALRAFEAVARHLSYPRAADELGVTPAAVKQLVYRLEATLETPLFEREGRGLCLTDAGREGFEDMTAAMKHMTSAVERMRGKADAARLIVSVEASLAATWLVPKLEAFRIAHPGAVVLIESSQEIVDLNRGEADVAIRYGVPTRSGLITHRLFDDVIFPVCSPALAGGLDTLDDLHRVSLIHWDISHLGWAHTTKQWFDWSRWFQRIGVPAMTGAGALYFSDYGQAVQAAIAGQGVVLASGPILRDTLTSGLLVAPFAQTLSTDIGYDLATTKAAINRPEVNAFIQWMLGVAAATTESGAGNPTPSPVGHRA